MDQEEVRIAVNVQLDHTAPRLSCLLTFLVVMEHTQIQKDKTHVSTVQKDSSVQILLPLQCPVKMELLASLAPLSAQFVLQGTGKDNIKCFESFWKLLKMKGL